MAAEARNNLVAASQNIEGAQRTLGHVEFPYCNQDEVDTLNKVTDPQPKHPQSSKSSVRLVI